MTDALFGIAQYAAENDREILDSIRDSIDVNPETGEISFHEPALGNVDTTALSSALSNMYGETALFMPNGASLCHAYEANGVELESISPGTIAAFALIPLAAIAFAVILAVRKSKCGKAGDS